MTEARSKPRLCILGLMLDEGAQYKGQCLSLVRFFKSAGYQVQIATGFLSPLPRLLHFLWSTLIARFRSDLIILDVYGGRSFVIEDMVSFFARLLRIPIVFILRGGALPKFAESYPRWSRRVLSRAATLICPSNYLASHFRAHNYKTSLIPNVISIDAYPFKQRCQIQPRLLWMRTFEDYYNPEMAVKAFREIKNEFPNAELVMAGNDRNYSHLIEKMVRDFGLESSVRFAGFLDHPKKLKEGHASDIYLHTSRIDNMPISVVEACALGLPVIATNVGGIPYLLENEKNALLVSDDNHLEMASAVRRLLADPKLTEKISTNGRRLTEDFDWSNVSVKWNQLFSEMDH